MLLCSSSSAPRTSSLLAKGLDWTEAVLGARWSWAQSFKAPHSHHLEVPTADQQLPNLPSIPAPTLHREQQSPPIPASYYQPGSSPLTSIAMETVLPSPRSGSSFSQQLPSQDNPTPLTLPQAQPYCPSPSSATLIPNQSRASGKKQAKTVFFSPLIGKYISTAVIQ